MNVNHQAALGIGYAGAVLVAYTAVAFVAVAGAGA